MWHSGIFIQQGKPKEQGKSFFIIPSASLNIIQFRMTQFPSKKKDGYDGIAVHVYIWMEGTDADCVNGKSVEDDPSTYDVTVKFSGVASGN